MGRIERDIIVYGTLKTEPPISKAVEPLPHSNYVENCWREFTTLTDDEELIIKQLQKLKKEDLALFFARLKYQCDNKRKQRVRRIKCVETGKIFASVKHCADAMSVGIKAIYKSLRSINSEKPYMIGKKYSFEYV